MPDSESRVTISDTQPQPVGLGLGERAGPLARGTLDVKNFLTVGRTTGADRVAKLPE